jgi:hypothetical protein
MVTFDGDTHPVDEVEFMSMEFAGSIVVSDAPEGAKPRCAVQLRGCVQRRL